MIIIAYFTSIIQSTHQLCLKDLDEEFQLSIPDTYLRITYQLAQQETINIINKTMIEIISTYKETITFSYSNNIFQIYSNNQLKISNITLTPGEYMLHQIYCREYQTSACNFKSKTYQLQEMQFKICLDQDFANFRHEEFEQQQYLNSHLVYDLDNKQFHTSLWIKEIVPSNQPIQIIYSIPSGCIFIFNFKTNKIICCNINLQMDLIIQESMVFNYWFYFEFNQFFDQKEFHNYFISGSFKIEQTKSFKTQINYSFQNQLWLNYPNSIISKFKILQSLYKGIDIKICMPDCKECNSYGSCLECKNDLNLYDGMCYCQNFDLISDQDGNCKYPANFLELKELESTSKCQFGYQFSDVTNDCIQCPYEENLPEINCLQKSPQKQDYIQKLLKEDFAQLFQKEFSKTISKYRCPKYCLSCIIIDKTIKCSLCKQGQLDHKGLCQLCNMKYCQYCLTTNKEICLLCFEFYSLNSYSKCIQSREYQFDKLISLLQRIFKQGDQYCQASDSNGCKLCSQGYFKKNGICVKYNQFNVIYDQNSIFAKYPFISIGINQNNKLYLKNLELLNLQKLYFESSIKSRIYIDQQLNNVFTPRYYSKDINQYSFCKNYNNCDNYLELEVIIQRSVKGIGLLFDNAFFYNINYMLSNLQLYDINPLQIFINIYADLSEFIGINELTQLIQLDSTNKFNIKLNYFGGNIVNDVKDKGFLNIQSPKIIYFNNINFINDYEQQLIINFENDQVFLKNVFTKGIISFIFKNQTRVTIQFLILSDKNIDVEFIFQFLCQNVQVHIENLYIYNLQINNSRIFLIQSEIISFIFKNSSFFNISLQNSSLISYGVNISQFNYFNPCEYKSTILLDNLGFIELTFNQSYIFQLETENLVIINEIIIQNNDIKQCKAENSDLFIFVGAIYKILRIDTIMMTFVLSKHSTFFSITQQMNNEIELTNISLINCGIGHNYPIVIKGDNQVIINALIIYQLTFYSENSGIIYLDTKTVQINNFTLINKQGRFVAYHLMSIRAYYIQMQNIHVNSSGFDFINLQNGITLQSSFIKLINMNISNLNFLGNRFLCITLKNQSKLVIQGLDLKIACLQNQQFDEDNYYQNLIIIQSHSNYSAYLKDLYILLNYKEQQRNFSRSAIYFTGYSFIKLSNLTFIIDNNGSVPNNLIYIEGNILEIINIDIIFYSFKQIQNVEKQQNYIFHILCKFLNLQFINLYIKDQLIGIFYLQSNIYMGDTILIKNVNVFNGSQIDSFFTAPFGAHYYILFSNIKIISSINTQVVVVFLSNKKSRLLIYNLTLIQQNSKNINAVVINGHQTLQVTLINIKLEKKKFNGFSETSDKIYFTIFAKQLNLHDFKIFQLDQSALKVDANEITLRKFMMANARSVLDIVAINISSRLMIFNAFILQSRSLNSIINVNLNSFKQLYFRNIQFKQNIIEKGHLIVLETNNVQNYTSSEIRQINLLFYNVQSIQNICKICYKFINNLNINLTLKIKENFKINNSGNAIFEFQNLSSQFSNSFFQNNCTQFEQLFISSNQQVLLMDSSIILNGIITQSSNQNYIVYLRSTVYINQNQDQTLKQHSQLYPTELKLSINKLSQKLKLQQLRFSQNYQEYQLSNIIYFPSGMPLNGYKILKLDKKQYFEYLDYIYIYGYNEDNNVLLYINQCDLTTDNNNITILPNYINSNLLLSDVVFVGNPYLIDNFTLQVNCQYDEMQLQLVIDSKLFKCQLGEILYQNKCKQCNIKDNLYSVKKHSQMCKLVDYDEIEDVQIGLIKLKQGYWRPYYSNDQIEHCASSNCLGGWDVDYNSCVKGYIGPLCSECDYNNIRGHGHYSKYRQQCFECQNEVNYIFNILYIVIVSLITLTITTRSQYLICQRYQILICQNKYYQILNKLSIDQISVLIKQIQNYFFYLQFVNIIFNIDLDLGIIINTVSNPIQILNPQYDCIISQFNLNQQIIKIIIQIITPICILTIFYAKIIIINRYFKFKQFYIFIYTPILQFFIIYQIVICQSAISLLTYIKISGIKWIYGAKQYQYFESNNIYLFAILSVILLIFAIIIPLSFVVLLYKKQSILQSKVILMKIGYLYQEYTNNKYYWEFLKMTIKIIFMTLSFAFINHYNKRVPISVFYLVCIIQLLKILRPHYLQNLNRFDQQFHILFVMDLLIIAIVQHVYYIEIRNLLIMTMYSINAIFFFKIIKIIIIKTYYNNPLIIDKFRLKVMNYKGMTLVETKKQINQKYSLLKRYAKAQTKQINDININNPKHDEKLAHSPILVSNIMSNISPQEIELVTFQQQ